MDKNIEDGVLKDSKICKMQEAFDKARRIALKSFFAVMLGAYVAGYSGAFASGTVTRFQDTDKYKQAVESEQNVAMAGFENNELTQQELDEKIASINSTEHAKEIMKDKDVVRYVAYNALKGVMYCGVVGMSAGFVAVGAGAVKAHRIIVENNKYCASKMAAQEENSL